MRLREIEREDVERINGWRHDPDVADWLGGPFHYVARSVDEAWYENYLRQRADQVRLAVIVDEKHVGVANLTSIHAVNRTAEYSCLIGDPSARGRGLGTEITRRVVRHAFEDLNLNRIYSYILADNEPSLRMCRNAGMKVEGTLRQAAFKNGRLRDLQLLAVIREEFGA